MTPQQRRTASIVGAIVLVALVLWAYRTSSRAGPPGSPSPATRTIRYEVTGTDPGTVMTASMTFTNEGGNTAQQSGQPLPWSYDLTAAPGAFLYVSAQNNNDAGEITCTITVDGQTVKQTTSSGGYAICTASGRL